jgi:hypothetical protein
MFEVYVAGAIALGRLAELLQLMREIAGHIGVS